MDEETVEWKPLVVNFCERKENDLGPGELIGCRKL